VRNLLCTAQSTPNPDWPKTTFNAEHAEIRGGLDAGREAAIQAGRVESLPFSAPQRWKRMDTGRVTVTTMALLIWGLVAAVCAVAFWIGHLVKDVNERFDQIEHKLDVIIDQLDRQPFNR
jgi:hypothetical protein